MGAAAQKATGATVKGRCPPLKNMDNMEALRQTYRYIESYHHRVGISPTEREIGKAFGLTPTGAHYRVVRMETLGWLRRGGVRAIVLRGMK